MYNCIDTYFQFEKKPITLKRLKKTRKKRVRELVKYFVFLHGVRVESKMAQIVFEM